MQRNNLGRIAAGIIGALILAFLFRVFPRAIMFVSEAGITFVRFWSVMFGVFISGIIVWKLLKSSKSK